MRLEDLPPLTEETYDPETYARLVTHLQRSVDRLMEQWKELLTHALARATDEHELGRELINLRAPLARRVALSRLNNLPAPVRNALRDDAVRAISELQSKLEEALSDPGSGARIDQATADRLVAVARAAPLTDALSMITAKVDQSGPSALTPGLPPLAGPDLSAPRGNRRSRWSHRAIGFDPNTHTGDSHA